MSDKIAVLLLASLLVLQNSNAVYGYGGSIYDGMYGPGLNAGSGLISSILGGSKSNDVTLLPNSFVPDLTGSSPYYPSGPIDISGGVISNYGQYGRGMQTRSLIGSAVSSALSMSLTVLKIMLFVPYGMFRALIFPLDVIMWKTQLLLKALYAPPAFIFDMAERTTKTFCDMFGMRYN